MRLFKWAAIHTGFLAIFYLGFFAGSEGAYRLAMFILWAQIVLSPFMLNEKVIQMMREEGRSSPAWMSHAFDIGITGLLIWLGAVWTGSLYAIATLLQEVGWDQALKHTDKKQTTKTEAGK